MKYQYTKTIKCFRCHAQFKITTDEKFYKYSHRTPEIELFVKKTDSYICGKCSNKIASSLKNPVKGNTLYHPLIGKLNLNSFLDHDVFEYIKQNKTIRLFRNFSHKIPFRQL